MPKKELDKPIFQGSEKEHETIPDFEKLAKQKERILERCVYCQSKKIVKRGKRKKKLEEVQLYRCNDCRRTFTGQKIKGKTFPLKIILDGLSYYYQGYTQEKACGLIKEHYGIEVKPSTLSEWLDEFKPLCTYVRMRKHGKSLFNADKIIQSVRMYHKQVYDFRWHKAKTALILQDFKHERFEALREFLDSVAAECPHELFKEGARASEVKTRFSLSEVIIKEKQNFAVRIANLALQAVEDNRARHEMLQRFMLANDSVTVACEVPVYMDNDDLEHMKKSLNFQIPVELSDGNVLSGHIDFIQIRNGSVYILDFKPNASKVRPIEQLTLYAIALSRLTGLRLYDFKCGWFDDKKYYEFFPLHVVYKLRRRPKISRDQERLY